MPKITFSMIVHAAPGIPKITDVRIVNMFTETVMPISDEHIFAIISVPTPELAPMSAFLSGLFEAK